ncbi:hypothetical protein TTHERM_00317470 (macronuclear) [Tetrahymena thermophila SB210]|uniref:Uncharacterized protein n=1 Tax=Tetrahymena thermophila (strain SB210) TaxID=312017 RepID=I7MG76_TETTS|nr:hypothetical protein TTHERM_00317470 [Tetrahymena thermophila SB210]EAS01183.1 hypothetical protein TTHERM_00317470 [Tetrahymena thermophila SB210]|eukprot:XP_001021428.1 hypothetical protein TTHERM_00317470 [Tetrahymena thermophila SB210]
MKKQDSIINRDQFLELIFRQIDMVDDYEALQEILEKVTNKLQMVGNQYGSMRRIPSSSKQAQKEDIKRMEHYRKAERENELNMQREDSFIADYDLWEGEESLERHSSLRPSPSAGRQEKPTYHFKQFDWVYQDKFNKYVLQLQQPPLNLNTNMFDQTNNQSQNTKIVQGSQIHLLIERYLNDPKKNEKILLENEFLTNEQGQWIQFLVNTVKEYCKDYLHLEEMKTEKHISSFLPKICLGNSTSHKSHDCSITGISTSQTNIASNQQHQNQNAKKVDVIFYNEHKAVIIDWKFSPFSINDQVYMNDSNHFIDQIQEVKKFFNFQKEVTLLIVPLKKISGLNLYELTSDEIELLQKEQVNQEIFYQTKYKKMRNQILSKQYNINQKCLIGEGKKQNLSIKEYFIHIIELKKKSQLEYYGNYKNCYGKNSPSNKDQFWALHVLLKEFNKKNEQIIQLIYSKQPTIQQKKMKGKSNDEVDFFTMNENNQLVLTKQNSATRHKYRQNKTVLQYVIDQIQDIFDDDEEDYSDYGDDAYQIIIQEKDDDQTDENVEFEEPQNQNEMENEQQQEHENAGDF